MTMSKRHFYILLRVLFIFVFGFFVFTNIGTYTSPETNFICLFFFIPIFFMFFIWNIIAIIMTIAKKDTLKINMICGIICLILSAFAGGVWLYGDMYLPQKPEALLSTKQLDSLECLVYPNLDIDKTYTNTGTIHFGTVAIENLQIDYFDTVGNSLGQISISYSKNSPDIIQKMFLKRSQERISRFTYLNASSESSVKGSTDNLHYCYKYVPDFGIMYILVENTKENLIYYITLYTPIELFPESIEEWLKTG